MLKRWSFLGLFAFALLLGACSQSPEPQTLPDSFPNEAFGLISPEGQAVIDAVVEGRLSTDLRPDAIALDSAEANLEPQACWRSTLRLGSRDASVKYLQTRLLAFGGTPASHIRNSGGADGVFGSGTDKAIRAFQSHFGIGVDGILGAQTWSQVGCSSLEGDRVWTKHTHGISMSHFLADRTSRLPSNADWSNDVCSNSPDTGLAFDFTNPCIRHDFGYRNYKKYSMFTENNRHVIDDIFLADMKAHCATRSIFLKPDCYTTAYAYYAAVRNFGG